MSTAITPSAFTIIRRPRVCAEIGLSRSSLYDRISKGLLPRPISLGGGRSVGWPAAEIEAINRARISGRSDDEIKLLVRVLEAQRATFAPGPEAA